jgi:hypothetical protein
VPESVRWAYEESLELKREGGLKSGAAGSVGSPVAVDCIGPLGCTEVSFGWDQGIAVGFGEKLDGQMDDDNH